MHVVLLNSGGKDTLATAALLRSGNFASVPELSGTTGSLEIHSVYIDIGWRNGVTAMSAAQMIADEYCDSHEIVKIEGSWQVPHGLGFPGYLGMTGMYTQNVIIHTLGAMYGIKNQWNMIASGLNAIQNYREQFAIFGDCLRATYDNGQAWFDPDKRPRFIFPILHSTQEELIPVWRGAPLLTFTVACNEETPCGLCFKCDARAKVIAAVNNVI